MDNKFKCIKISIREILYYLFFFTMLMAKGMGLYEGMWSYTICLVFALGCVFFKLLLERHTIFELVGILFFGFLGLIIYKISGDKAPLIFISLIIGLKGISISRTFKLGFPIWLFCLMVRAMLAMSGIEKGFVLAHEKLGLGPILRWSFGYPHPNVLQITYAVLVAFILFLTNKKGKELCKLLVLLFLGNLFIFLYAVSYTGFVLTTLMLLMYFYFVSRKEFTVPERIVINCILPFSILFSVIGPLLTGEGMIFANLDRLMNKILNMRYIASRIYLLNGISLFGRDYSEVDLGFALDCSYVSLLVNNGIVLFLLVIGLYAGAIHFYLKNNKRKELAIILAFIITGISEPFLFNTSFKNLSFLFLGEYIFYQMSYYKEMFSSSILNKSVGINLTEKCMVINMTTFYWLKKIATKLWQKNKKVIIIFSFFGGVLLASIYEIYSKSPDAIYVSVSNTDCQEREKYYLDLEKLPEDFNSLVYEYQGKDVPLYRFEGKMIILERIRDTFGWWLIGSFFVGIIIIIIYIIKDYLKRKRK